MEKKKIILEVEVELDMVRGAMHDAEGAKRYAEHILGVGSSPYYKKVTIKE